MLGLIGAAAAAASIQTSAPPDCDATLCYAQSLAPFFERLRAGAPVHIIQIGDSHTAGDAITGGWRTRLQARYGYGGRGVLAAGRPYPGYLTRGVTAGQSEGWRVNALIGARYRAEGPPLGLSGFTQTAHAAGETLSVAADTPEQDFDRIIVCALTGPGAGTILLRLGEAEMRWPLAAPRPAPACRSLDSDTPAPSASITTNDDRAVSIASFATFRRSGGAVLSNLGVSGAQVEHLTRTDEALVRAELAAYAPDLIVLAFGTNEGFSAQDPDWIEAMFRSWIGRLRELAGEAVPILLLGAPEAKGCAAPPLLATVRSRQRIAARDMGAAYWDWAAAMGGRCAAARWQEAGWMRGDLVHFTREGGERIGAALDADLMRAAAALPPH